MPLPSCNFFYASSFMGPLAEMYLALASERLPIEATVGDWGTSGEESGRRKREKSRSGFVVSGTHRQMKRVKVDI